MAATHNEIANWLTRKITPEWYENPGRPVTHMLVVCDTFDYEDYPVYVSDQEDVHEVIKKHDGPNMQKVMEVYSYKMDLKAQLATERVWNV